MNENALSIIQGVDSKEVTNVLTQISSFQKVINSSLRDGQDYGVIPGTNKPTLLKPGAEKINMLLQTVPEYEFLEKTVDFTNDFFNYEIRCTLYRNLITDSGATRVAVSQGVGSCNSHEKKYRYLNVKENELPPNVDKGMLRPIRDRYGNIKYQIENPDVASLANTILKMAKKRAYVDATLQLAALSDIFTQDLEDMDIAPASRGHSYAKKSPAPEAKAVSNEPIYGDEDESHDPRDLIVDFGKHNGTTLGELAVRDRGYLEWLSNNARDEEVKSASKQVLSGAGKVAGKVAGKAKPADATPEPSEPDDYYSDVPLPWDEN